MFTATLLAVHLYRGLQWLQRRCIIKNLGLDPYLWDDRLWSGGTTWIDKEQDNRLSFDPPVYQQRYSTVAEVLKETPQRKKVVELGCAELKLFPILKQVDGVEQTVHVDIDMEVLWNANDRIKPQLRDHLTKRHRPLHVEVYCGDASKFDAALCDADVVVAIELIEHLYPETFEGVTENIFKNIRPRTAIISTPNVEFNVLFSGLVGMRHWDHKFEWTRKQFQEWAVGVTNVYTEYSVKLYGVGPGPVDSLYIGRCSQMAIFTKTELPCATMNIPFKTDLTNYSLICEEEFPYHIDDRTVGQKVSDVVNSKLFTVRHNMEEDVSDLPVRLFMIYLDDYGLSVNEVCKLLRENGHTITYRNGEPNIEVPESQTTSDDEESMKYESEHSHEDGCYTNVVEDWDYPQWICNKDLGLHEGFPKKSRECDDWNCFAYNDPSVIEGVDFGYWEGDSFSVGDAAMDECSEEKCNGLDETCERQENLICAIPTDDGENYWKNFVDNIENEDWDTEIPEETDWEPNGVTGFMGATLQVGGDSKADEEDFKDYFEEGQFDDA